MRIRQEEEEISNEYLEEILEEMKEEEEVKYKMIDNNIKKFFKFLRGEDVIVRIIGKKTDFIQKKEVIKIREKESEDDSISSEYLEEIITGMKANDIRNAREF
ncbi:hypothetical protein ENUP19_0011G0028 [Entamoeba nuttalli]|uniref:Uncharacterized protein n=1 Tax=Entamoeba nuttalli TaxID=412467 RepID=A0ABQ0D859_9EUKA